MEKTGNKLPRFGNNWKKMVEMEAITWKFLDKMEITGNENWNKLEIFWK